MNSKQKILISVLSFTLILVLFSNTVAAEVGFEVSDFDATGVQKIFNFLGQVFVILGKFISMEWMGSDAASKVYAFRFLLWILVFMIFLTAGNIMFTKMYNNQSGGPAKRNAIILAVIIATTTAMLIPKDVLVSLFAAYGMLGIMAAFGLIIGLVLYFVYGQLKVESSSPFVVHLLRVLALLLTAWLFKQISKAADEMFAVDTFNGIGTFINLVLIILIFIEIVKMFTGKSTTKDAFDYAKAGLKKAFGDKDGKIENTNAETEKNKKELEETKKDEKEDKDKLVDLQRLINGLTIQGKDRISKLLNGHNQLKAAATQPQFVDLAPKLSEKIVVPMNNEATELSKEVSKIRMDTLAQLQVFRKLTTDINKEKKALQNVNTKRKEKESLLVNEIEGIRIESNKVLQKTKNQLLKKEDKDKFNAELDALTKKRIKTQEALAKIQSDIRAEEDKAKLELAEIEKILDYLKTVGLFDDRKLMRLETSMQAEIKAISTELEHINKCLDSLYKQKTDSSADVNNLTKEKIENYDQKLPVLEQHIHNVAEGYQSLSVIAANTSAEIKKMMTQFGGSNKDLNMGSVTNELNEKADAKNVKPGAQFYAGRRT